MHALQSHADPADSSAASFWPDVVDAIDRGTMNIEQVFDRYRGLFDPLIHDEAMRLATWVLETIEAAPSPAIGFVAVNRLLGRHPYMEKSLAFWARKCGTSKKILSGFIVTQRDKINLRPVGTAKSARARRSFSDAQKKHYETQRKNRGSTARDPIFGYRQRVEAVRAKIPCRRDTQTAPEGPAVRRGRHREGAYGRG